MRQRRAFFIDRQYCSIRLTMLFHDHRVHQTAPVTWEDRYPEVFDECRAYFARRGLSDIRILSFGCSTGEEVITLRRYFPAVEIVGAEINRASLRSCRKRKTDQRTSFIYSTPEKLAANGPYDMIFCMAVLQRWPQYITDNQITDISAIYPFEKYERQLTELDQLLKSGGLLAVHHSPYCFSDTVIAGKYRNYGNAGFENELFAPDGKRRSDRAFQHSIHLKLY